MKKHQGFTLIEVLMIVFIMGIVAVIGGNMLFSIMKGTSKSEITKEVKQNGDYAINVMERMIRNAQGIASCSSSSLKIKNPDGGETEFKCISEDEVTKIASGSGRLTGKDVSLGGSCPGSLSFSCNLTKTPPVVTISFTLSQKGTGLRPEEMAQVRFQRTVSLRTY